MSAFLRFSREQWCRFRADTPLTLTEEDVSELRGQIEAVSLKEIEEIYLPLSRLLSLYVIARQNLHQVSGEFLGTPEPKVPFIIGVAGSVAVGKSTTSRVLQALLSRWPDHPDVALVPTDGFLYPNEKLKALDLELRKGFPESYDTQSLLKLLDGLKSGKRHLTMPVYSHHHYDIMPNEVVEINQPDIVIVEGINVLQTGTLQAQSTPRVFVSDYFDFSIFVDAKTEMIGQWFVDRVLKFCDSAFQKPDAYFHYLTKLNLEERIKFAERVWAEINEVNLYENILPFRERAGLILSKVEDHSVQEVLLRKL